MHPIRPLLLAGAAAAAAAFTAPVAASAQPVQVAQASNCGVTLTGTITRVISPSEFSIRTNSRIGSIHVLDGGARIYANGLRLAAGNYAGVSGCFTAGQRAFVASRVTLSGSQSAYYAYAGPAQGPCHVSLFGTVTRLFPNRVEFGFQTLRSPVGNIHVYDRFARVNANGLPLQPGVFAGLYGCFVQNGRAFHAEQITLASSAQSYAGYRRPIVSVTGTVDEVGNGWIGVATRYYGHVHVYTNQRGFRAGERISIQGAFNPVQSSINANSIAVI